MKKWLFYAVANVSTWKVTKGKFIYFIHFDMAEHFMEGVPPRHTHGENRVKCVTFWTFFEDSIIKGENIKKKKSKSINVGYQIRA